MSDERSRPDADHCFVCGTTNPIGLGIQFVLNDGVCRGQFTPGEHHVGFDQITHGGIIYSVLDDVMANWLFLQGAKAFTAKCEIRYREPLPIGTLINVECRLKRRKGRLVLLESIARKAEDETVFAEAQASFMVEDFGQLTA